MLNKLKDLLKSTNGSILPTMAILIVPITITLGAAVDYTNFSSMRSEVQSASDAATIAAAKQITSIDIPDSIAADKRDEFLRAELEKYAETFFKANVSQRVIDATKEFKLELQHGTVTTNGVAPTRLAVKSVMEYDTLFGGYDKGNGGNLLGIDVIKTNIETSVALSNRTIEVALVVDNSGSMSWNGKIGNVIKAINGDGSAVRGLLPTLFDSGVVTNIPDPVKVSLVPFNMMVNVGSNNSEKKWMDRRGWNGHAWDAMNPNTFQGHAPLTVKKRNGRIFGYKKSDNTWLRKKDFFEMLNVSWAGCVEQRPWPYNTTDHAITTSAGNFNSVRDQFAGRDDGYNALFSMYLAPDMPDSGTYKHQVKYGGSIYFERRYDEDRYGWNDYLDDFAMPNKTHNKDADGNVIPIQFGANTVAGDHSNYAFWSETDTDGASRYFPRLDPNRPAFDPDRRYHEDQFMRGEWMFKYQSPVWHSSSQKSHAIYGGTSVGPNWECSSKPITPLTNTKNTIQNKVAAMTAKGGTNIQQGIAWGWRSLSSTEPFAEGRAESDEENLKFVIVLTDGENSVPRMDDAGSNNSPFITSYNPMGYFYDSNDSRLANFPHANRIMGGTDTADIPSPYTNADILPAKASNNQVSRSDYSRVMNVHTLQTCNNAKADGVTIFTIAFDIPDSSAAAQLMKECAGPGIFSNGLEKIRASKYDYSADNGDIDEVMQKIADVIGQIRITE